MFRLGRQFPSSSVEKVQNMFVTCRPQEIILTLVVGPETGRIVDDALLRVPFNDASIAAPQVPVHERRLHFPAVALQWPKKPRNDNSEEGRDDGVQLGIRPGPFFSELQDMAKTIGKEFLPAVAPRIVLRKIAIICHALEAEFPVGRLM